MSHDDRHDYELGQRLVEIERELRQYGLDASSRINLERPVHEEDEEE